MARSYREHLVYRTAEDGVSLTGVLIQPIEGALQPARIVWIHGNTGTFYEHSYITIGRRLAMDGYAFLSGATRGHDITTTLWRLGEDRPAAGGSAWERLENAPFDLAAWVEEAAGDGQDPVVLIGHSLGAAKVILYQAERHDPRIRGLVLASPALKYRYPPEIVSQARRLVAQEQGDDLLPPLFGDPWYRLSARTLVSRAAVLPGIYQATGGPAKLSSIDTPVLAFFGTQDVGGEDELTTIRQGALSAPGVETQVIDGADHMYTGRESEVARLIATWIGSLS
ncbi:MAG: alpha/beta hydrolase [Dehalococcoidia bacterium]